MMVSLCFPSLPLIRLLLVEVVGEFLAANVAKRLTFPSSKRVSLEKNDLVFYHLPVVTNELLFVSTMIMYLDS